MNTRDTNNVTLAKEQLEHARAELLQGIVHLRLQVNASTMGSKEIALLCDAVEEYLKSEIAIEQEKT